MIISPSILWCPIRARSRHLLPTLAAITTLAFGCKTDTTTREATPDNTVTISVLGTSDIHGHLERLPILAGHVEALRATRKRSGGGVVVIDAGDMFQGTLESNSAEGEGIIEAFNVIGYDAAAIGNHEFDFGPLGARTIAQSGDDSRGALKARAKQANFPFLAANVVETASGQRPRWDNVKATTVVDTAGVRVGIIGVTTIATPRTTMPANFVGLRIKPLRETVIEHAQALRKEHNTNMIVLAAHAGGACHKFDNPSDLTSCKDGQEVFDLAYALPKGLVDVIVAGHTHQAIAHFVNGIAVVQAYSKATAFARVDLDIAVDTTGRATVANTRIFAPHNICKNRRAKTSADCHAAPYEGTEIRASQAVQKIATDWRNKTAKVREDRLGVEVVQKIKAAYNVESALGNLFSDLMLKARPQADVAIANGGGLRANLPAGQLTYGQLYEALPFDNRFALVTMTGRHLREMARQTLKRKSGILSFGGARVEASCAAGRLKIVIKRPTGRIIKDDDKIIVATSDYLASGGDGTIGRLGLAKTATVFENRDSIRDAMADVLRKRGGRINTRAKPLFDPKNRRISYPGKRPVRCK